MIILVSALACKISGLVPHGDVYSDLIKSARDMTIASILIIAAVPFLLLRLLRKENS